MYTRSVLKVPSGRWFVRWKKKQFGTYDTEQEGLQVLAKVKALGFTCAMAMKADGAYGGLVERVATELERVKLTYTPGRLKATKRILEKISLRRDSPGNANKVAGGRQYFNCWIY